MAVDPKVHTTARYFVEDLLSNSPYGARVSVQDGARLITRVAEAMQSAAEAELTEIEEQLDHRFGASRAAKEQP